MVMMAKGTAVDAHRENCQLRTGLVTSGAEARRPVPAPPLKVTNGQGNVVVNSVCAIDSSRRSG